MKTFSDEDLARLLAETFASREQETGPQRAHEVVHGALHPGRSWGRVAGAAAVAVLVAGTAGYLLARNDVSQPVTSTASVSPSPSGPPDRSAHQTYARHRAAAARASRRALASVRLPTDARRLEGRPDRWPRDVGAALGPSDPSLTRTAWYAIPGSATDLQEFLLTHHPDSMSREPGVGVGGGPDGIRDLTYDPDRAESPAAFTGPSLLVQWKQIGRHTVVRVDSFLAARGVRPARSYLTGHVHSVSIEQVAGSLAGHRKGGPLPTARLVSPGDDAALDRLVHLVNGLRASIRHASAPSCPFPGDPPPSLTLVFHTSRGTVTMRLKPACLGQVRVSRDGRALESTLDPGRLFATATGIARAHRDH